MSVIAASVAFVSCSLLAAAITHRFHLVSCRSPSLRPSVLIIVIMFPRTMIMPNSNLFSGFFYWGNCEALFYSEGVHWSDTPSDRGESWVIFVFRHWQEIAFRPTPPSMSLRSGWQWRTKWNSPSRSVLAVPLWVATGYSAKYGQFDVFLTANRDFCCPSLGNYRMDVGDKSWDFSVALILFFC